MVRETIIGNTGKRLLIMNNCEGLPLTNRHLALSGNGVIPYLYMNSSTNDFNNLPSSQ